MRLGIALLAWLLVAVPAALEAQTLQGRILSEADDEPVGDVVVRLLDSDGKPVVGALSDAAGRFTLEAPEPGAYRIVADHLGYERFESALLEVRDPARSYPVDLVLTPTPVPIEGVVVTAERIDRVERELRAQLAMNPDALRWEPLMRPTVVEHAQRGHGVREMIQWSRTPGVTVQGVGEELCFRYRTQQCLPVYLDGAPIRPEFVSGIPLEMIEVAVVLTPTESVVYGGGGIILYSTGWMR